MCGGGVLCDNKWREGDNILERVLHFGSVDVEAVLPPRRGYPLGVEVGLQLGDPVASAAAAARPVAPLALALALVLVLASSCTCSAK